jgi:hypothetical protein
MAISLKLNLEDCGVADSDFSHSMATEKLGLDLLHEKFNLMASKTLE